MPQDYWGLFLISNQRQEELWFAVIMVWSLMTGVKENIGFRMTNTKWVQAATLHCPLHKNFSQCTILSYQENTIQKYKTESPFQNMLTKKWIPLAQWRGQRAAVARVDATKTEDAKIRVWSAIVGVCIMGTLIKGVIIMQKEGYEVPQWVYV